MSELDECLSHQESPDDRQGGLEPLGEQAALPTLWEEVQALRSRDRHQNERIRQLEQALDQSVHSIGELKQQIADRMFLESLLAATEEFARIQQQAINELKAQLQAQQAVLAQQINEIQGRDQAVHSLINATESIAHAQRDELERLRSQMVHEQAEMARSHDALQQQITAHKQTITSQQNQLLKLEAQRRSALETTTDLEQKLAEAEAQIEVRQKSLEDYLQLIGEFEERQAKAEATIAQQQGLAAQLHDAQETVSQQNSTIVALQRDLAVAHGKLEALETQIANQTRIQARLQQNKQELQAERDRHLSRVNGLESQVTELQEQVLKQARQTSEYEAAIQHWKDRYQENQQQLSQLRDMLEQLPDCPEEVVDLLATLTPASDTKPAEKSTEAEATPAPRFTKGLTVDLPTFLARRRSYRTQQSTS